MSTNETEGGGVIQMEFNPELMAETVDKLWSLLDNFTAALGDFTGNMEAFAQVVELAKARNASVEVVPWKNPEGNTDGE